MKILLLRSKELMVAALCGMLALLLTLSLFILPFSCRKDDEVYVKVPIIMYHMVLNDPPEIGRYVIKTAQLEEDLRHIRDSGYTTITVADLIDYVYNGKALPKKPIMLSFDDGYYNTYCNVFPLMQKYHMKMVLAVVGNWADAAGETNVNDPNYSYATWAQIAEMYRSGLVEIQNHSNDLHVIGTRWGSTIKNGESLQEYRLVLVADLLRMQLKTVEYTDGYLPTAFVYPYGLVSYESKSFIKEMGFKASFSCILGVNLISTNPDSLYSLKRLLRTGEDTTAAFFGRIEG